MINPAAMIFARDAEDAVFEFSTGVEARPVALPASTSSGSVAGLRALLAGENTDVPSPPKVPQSGYHLATADHPFLDMSRGVTARVEDAQIMAGYAEADEYPAVDLELNHDHVLDIEDAADLTLDELKNSDLCRLSAILSGTFGIRRHQPAYFDPTTGYHQVELVRKSIPSGGSRHPSELFVEVVRSPMVEAGLWHYRAARRQLQRVSSAVTEHEFDSDADWVLRTHIVSVVRRAMFRYRDPRSFRAILVDAGHADAQLEAMAKFCNWRYRSSTSISFGFGDAVGMDGNEIPELITGTLEGWS